MITKDQNEDLAQPRSCKTCALRSTCSLVANKPQPVAMGFFNIPMPGPGFLPMPCGGAAWKPSPRPRRGRSERFFADLVPETAEDDDADELELNDAGLPV